MFNDCSFGEFLLAVRGNALSPHIRQPLLQKRAALGASEAVPSDGGFLVSADHTQKFIERMYMAGAVLSRCTEMPVSSTANGITFPAFAETSRQNGSRFGGI